MKNTVNKIVNGWEKGYLYILFAVLLILAYVLNNRVGVMDWNKDSAYLHYIKISLTDYHTLPYFWWSKIDVISWIPPVKATSTFISIPETTLFSPLTPLLTYLNEIVYLKFYLLVQGIIGLIGVIALKKRLKWNNIQFRTYLIMFMFSPIIFQHIAVGYFPWYNIYFFPWLIFFLAELNTFKKILGMAIVLSLVLLQGGVYVFVWFVMLIVLYAFYHLVFEKKVNILLQILGSVALVFLLANVRIYAASIAFADFSREFFETNGYNPFNFLFYALLPTVTIQPLDLLFWTNLIWIGIPQHDAGLFWGFGVVMVTVIVFKYKDVFARTLDNYYSINYQALFFSAMTIFIFSFFSIWATITKTIQTFIDVPFFESVKNYGYRLGIPAYLGFSLVAADKVEKIWSILQKITVSKQWLQFKKIIIFVFKGSAILLGMSTFILILFRTQLLRIANKSVTAAYNNSGSYWLRSKMEGMNENSLEFYYLRFEGIYFLLIKIFLVMAMIASLIIIVAIIIKKERKRIAFVINRFPFLKFELVLFLPLLFSTAMWVHLATRTPYENRPKQEVKAPKITVISETIVEPPLTEATPKKLIITPVDNTNITQYLFPDINAKESNNLIVASQNGELSSLDGHLTVIPFDGNPITIEFDSSGINKALSITIISWTTVLLLFITVSFRKKKLQEA